jgi:hypothetical protein
MEPLTTMAERVLHVIVRPIDKTVDSVAKSFLVLM